MNLLRPAFTRQLAERLLSGEHIQLVSPHGLGRRQTVTDLRSLLPAPITVTYIDLLRMDQQLLPAMIDACHTQQGAVVLIVHNIDQLNEQSLITQLNRLKPLPHVGLLCVCLTPLPALDAIPLTLPNSPTNTGQSH